MSTASTATGPGLANLPTTGTSRAASPHFRLLLWAAVYIIPALSVSTPIEDLDVWWHLRTADWIVEHGALPHTDPFTDFGADRPYCAYSWLFELAVWAPYRVLGLTGVVAFRAISLLLLLALVHRFIAKRQPDFVPQIVLFALTCVAFVPLMSERPWLFTILFYLLTLDTILDLRAGKWTWRIWLLPMGFALWANIHIQFVYGLALLGLACAAPLLDGLIAPGGDSRGADRAFTAAWWWLVALTGLCALATLANPYHVGIYGVVRAYAGHTAGYRYFPELQAFGFRQAPDWIVLGLTMAAVFALGRRGRVSGFDALLLAGSAFLAFKSKRDLWFAVLAALMVLTTVRPAAFRGDGFPLTVGRRLALAGCVALTLLVAAWQRGLWGESLEAKVALAFPVRACAVVEQQQLPGPLYNPIDWGGYLIWRLPDRRAAIDGRANLHGNERVRRFHDTWNGRPGWHADPELAVARTVVVQTWAPLSSLLRLDPRFELIHEDPVALVFLARSDPPFDADRRSHAVAQ